MTDSQWVKWRPDSKPEKESPPPPDFDRSAKESPGGPLVDSEGYVCVQRIDDEAEPVFVVTNESDARLVYQNLEIAARQATGEISLSYARHAVMVLTTAQRKELLAESLTKENLRGELTWKQIVLCFPDEKLVGKLAGAGAYVTSIPDIPISLQQARDLVKVVMPVKSLGLRDMPESVLDGWLGELCRTRMAAFPIAYAWPALVTVASAMVPRFQGEKLNLYAALVGPVGSGKSQAIEWASLLLGIQRPPLMDILAGSAEGLLKKLETAAGSARLLNVDELGHLLEKAQIEGASFPYVLDRAWYCPKFEATMARGKEANFDCRISLIGGVVDEQFGDLFSSKTKGGLHDRFIFGQCPEGFHYRYRPFSGGPALQAAPEAAEDESPFGGSATLERPVAVTINPDVYEARDKWLEEEPNLQAGRVTEHALRVAVICAAFDGRAELRAADLGPALAFARYQARIRKLLKPNPGETMEAVMQAKALDWLDSYAPATKDGQPGQWVQRRRIYKAIHAERYGHGVADRAMAGLEANGDIETAKQGKSRLVRRLFDTD